MNIINEKKIYQNLINKYFWNFGLLKNDLKSILVFE